MAGVVVGQAAEKAINYFGQRIIERWLGWLQGKPRGVQVAALSQLADVLPEVARSEVTAALEQQAPQVSPADRQLAIDYLSSIPRSVRRSLMSDRKSEGRMLPPTVSVDNALSLLQLLPTDLPPYPAGTILPETDYRLEELIGSGGFGAVYRASGASLQHLPLAIKFCVDGSLLPALHQERTNLERLMKAGGESWSNRIVRLYGYNLEHRTPYLVYEYVPGGDLMRWLAVRQAPGGCGLTPDEVLALIVQVAEALAIAHQRGLVHRDLKPANILVQMSVEGRLTFKLADFGIGGLVARQAVQVSRIGTLPASQLSPAEQASLFRGAGTPLYMSPEQRRGEAPDPRHDLYSLGVLWYQLLLGDVTREMAHGWADELIEEHAVPAAHVEAIRKCVGLVKHRPENAGKLLDVLRDLAAPAPPSIEERAQPKPDLSPREAGLARDKAEGLREELVRAIIAAQQRHTPALVFSVIFGVLAISFAIGVLVNFFDRTSRELWPAVVFGILSPPCASLAVTLGSFYRRRCRRARENLIQEIDSVGDTLSLPVAAIDRDNRESLCLAGMQLASAIQKQYLKRNTSARIYLTGYQDQGAGKAAQFMVVLDCELLGEGSKAGFDLPAQLCRGTHYLELRWADGSKVGSWFAITQDGNCRVVVSCVEGVPSRLSVGVLWTHGT
jgi:serine/threonine protein kinase